MMVHGKVALAFNIEPVGTRRSFYYVAIAKNQAALYRYCCRMRVPTTESRIGYTTCFCKSMGD